MSLLLNKPAEAFHPWGWPWDTFGKWMRHESLRYGFAVLAVAAAAGLRHLLTGAFGNDLAYITFYPAVALVAAVAGFKQGLLATLLSAVCADYFFLEPLGQFSFRQTSDALGLALFSAAGLWISALVGGMRWLREWYAQARETAVLESITDAFFSLDREWRFTYVNAAMERTLDCRREDLLGQGIWDCFPDEVGTPFQQAFEKVMDEGVAVHDEIQCSRTLAWYELHVYPSVTGLCVYFRDISGRKRAEQQLKESQARLASIIDLAMDAIITVDADQKIVLFNPAAERMLGCPAAEALDGSMERFIPEHFRETHHQHLRRFAKTGVSSRAMGAPGSLSALRANGEEFPVEASISRVEVGGRGFFTVTLRDITERKRAEAALRESEERFRAMADNVPVLIWLSGPDKACTWFNQQWRDFTGRSLEQELGYGWAEGVHRDDLERCLSIYIEHFDRRAPFEMEYRLRRADGEYRWIVDQGVPRFGPDGGFLGYIGSAIDITERILAEQALCEADRHKDEFLAMLAHELRNPLAPIRNAVQVMWRLELSDPKLRWVGEVIDRQVHHLSRLVDDLLDVSRLVRGKILLRKEPVKLADIIHQAVETSRPLIEARKHRLSLSLPPESVWLEGDPVRLSQVLLNLLNNAAKYTHEGGQIWLEAERVGSEATIRVRDTGMGIPATLLPRIFDLFTQAEQSLDRAQGGLGIGLTLVQRLVRLHGGRVEVRSEGPGRGAEFSVWLPRLAQPANAEVREIGEPSNRSPSATRAEAGGG